jgi:ketosteroid isomerase-like protein
MSLRRIMLCAVCCLLIFAAKFSISAASSKAAPAAPDSDKAVIQEILKMHDICQAGELKPDKAVMDKCETDDFTHVHSNGMVEYKPGYIEGVVSGAHHFTKLDWSEVHVRTYGDTALLDGHEHLMANNKGSLADDYLAVLIVWVKQGGQWRQASWIAARLKDNSPGPMGGK